MKKAIYKRNGNHLSWSFLGSKGRLPKSGADVKPACARQCRPLCWCKEEANMCSTGKTDLAGMADKLFQAAQAEYKLYSLDIKNRQTTIQNIYFWIAATLFTLYGAIFQGMFKGTAYTHLAILEITPAILPKLIIVVAFVMCAYVVLTGVNVMRGRGTGNRLLLGEYSASSLLDSYLDTENSTYVASMRHLVALISENAYANAVECERVGKHLRKTSYALITAIICGLIAFIC